MTTINNPVEERGSKVKCLHYYEECLSRWYKRFKAIFVYKEKIYLYEVENPYNPKKTLTCFGDVEPMNMTKAVATFKKCI